jgi:hypothetical protein
MRIEMRTLLAASGLAMLVSGCSGVSDVIGEGKDAPDEFAIVTKQPLVIPPDFNLHPPKPGAAPTNQLSPTDAAQSAIFSDDPAQIASTISGNYSDGEKILIAKAGAADATDSIRQLIDADNKNLEAADSDFTSSLLFGGGSGDPGHPLNANAEKARLDATQGRPVAEAAPMPVQSMAPPNAYSAPDNSYSAPDNSYGATSGALPPIGGAPQSAPMATSAPMPVTAPPPRTASTYAAPSQAEAGTLPDLGAPQGYAPAQQSRPARKPHKDDSGWLDGIF